MLKLEHWMKRGVLFLILLAAGLVLAAVPGVRIFLPSGWGLAPAGEWESMGDMAAGGDLSPDRKWAAFVTVGQGVHQLVIVNASTGRIAGTAKLGDAWVGVAWQDSSTLWVCGGAKKEVIQASVAPDGSPSVARRLPLALEGPRAWLSGLAVMEGGKEAYLASAARDAVYRVSLEDGKILQTLDMPDGSSPYQVRRGPRGIYAVSLQGSAQIALIDSTGTAQTEFLPTGRHPNDILVDGDRLFVACGNDDVVEVLDLYNHNREERINVRPWKEAPSGSTPHALALSPDGKTLFVALSDNNCVGAMDVSVRGSARMKGWLPTAQYPCALAVLPSGSRLLVASGKGFGTGPNGFTDKISPVAPQGYPYIVTLLKGTLARIELNEADYPRHTRTVLEVARYKEGIIGRPLGAPKPGSSPIPSRLGDPSPIKHVLYIIKENRTYDQLFGDLKKDGKPYGNGDPKLTLFGQDVAPNHRRLATDYVLLDSLFCSGEVSVDGHHWSNGAYVPDFMQRTWIPQYSGRPAPRLAASLAATPAGRIWDQARKAGLSYRTYYYHTTDRMNEEWAKARAARERDYKAVDIFIRDFKQMEKAGTVPSFMVMALSEDHTSGTRPGSFTPQASVASNDLGIGRVVEALSQSSLWSQFAVFIIEDDAQNGADHVDAHRTVGLVVSPYTRGMGLDSTHYTTTSFLRTMEMILGLQPMSQFDAAAAVMYKSFQMKPDLTPYKALTPATDLLAINPARKQDPVLASIDFSEPDQLDLEQEVALNADIWRSVKGRSAPYPGPSAAQIRERGSERQEKDDD